MKNRLFSTIAAIFVMASFAGGNAFAQPGPQEDWKEKMQSVKIAFLTTEIGLTPTEAQNFWPIYNSVSEELDKAMRSTFSSYMELEKAINGIASVLGIVNQITEGYQKTRKQANAIAQGLVNVTNTYKSS